jgi:putative DNA primase/helicase
MNDARDRFAPLTDSERSAHRISRHQKTEDGDLVVPVPRDAPPPPASHVRLGKPTARWTYRNRAGEELGHIQRFDRSNGGKVFLPLTLRRTANGLRWLRKALPEPGPLYALDQLAARPEAPVLVCEGEKSVDAARQIFPDYVVTTSSGGAKAFNHTDWTPSTAAA